MKRIVFIPLLLLFLFTTALEAHAELGLRAIMGALENDMEEIVRGINYGDFKSIEEHAGKVADHEKPPLSERQKIMGFLKEDAAGFKAADTEVHDSAAEIAEAAKRGDLEGVITNYANTLRGCVKCHTGYREAVIERFYGAK